MFQLTCSVDPPERFYKQIIMINVIDKLNVAIDMLIITTNTAYDIKLLNKIQSFISIKAKAPVSYSRFKILCP